jgi:hypothetical protein
MPGDAWQPDRRCRSTTDRTVRASLEERRGHVSVLDNTSVAPPGARRGSPRRNRAGVDVGRLLKIHHEGSLERGTAPESAMNVAASSRSRARRCTGDRPTASRQAVPARNALTCIRFGIQPSDVAKQSPSLSGGIGAIQTRRGARARPAAPVVAKRADKSSRGGAGRPSPLSANHSSQ